jgi:glucose/arabinose dehydrogenase
MTAAWAEGLLAAGARRWCNGAMTRLLALVMWLTSAAAAEPPHLHVDADRLPPPGATAAVANPPKVVPRPGGAHPVVPAGYRASLWADGLSHARLLLALPDGSLLVAESNADTVTLLRDTTAKGRADHREVFARGFKHPSGLAATKGAVFVADLEGVWRLEWTPGGILPVAGRQRLTPEGALGDAGGHSTRTLAIDPQGARLYVGIGSRGNVGEEPEPRATIQVFAMDGSGGRTFASGLRNPVGLAFLPGTDDLWAVVNERDGLGDNLVPDFLTRVHDGGFYGWPYTYIGGHPQPGFEGNARPALVPDLLFQSHSAPLGLVFWHGDAYVALHGSWNRADPVGYMVVKVPFEGGRPKGWYEPFATGFTLSPEGKGRARVWGRPVGLAVGADDALYVSDDVGQTVWRITRTP